VDPDEYVAALMHWHFTASTGSPFWLRRARSLDFDPIADVRTFADLRLFPNVVDEFRDVPVEDLIPRGLTGEDRAIAGVYESGGTTGSPKRFVMFDRWMEFALGWDEFHYADLGPANVLAIAPSGPHMFGEFAARRARRHDGVRFTVDLDPRWIKRLIERDGPGAADLYAEHVIDQAAHILTTQAVGILITTPPLLERMARRDDLVALIRKNVRFICWSGAHMDADTREIFQTEVFPGIPLKGLYGAAPPSSGCPGSARGRGRTASHCSTRRPLTSLSGAQIGEISQVPALYVRRTIAAMRAAPVLPGAQRYDALDRAAELFLTASLGGFGPAEYVELVSTASGVPRAVVRQSVEWIADVLRSQWTTVELAMPRGAVGDWRDERTSEGSAVWARRGEVFAVHAAGNTPAVHGLWPEALALGYKVVVRPSAREPYTALRLVEALRQAGFPPATVTLLPTDHDVADVIIAEADYAIVYGGQDVVDKYSAIPTVAPTASVVEVDQYLHKVAGDARALLGGDTIVDELATGGAVLRPAVHLVDSSGAAQLGVELPFPCVWVGPWQPSDGVAPLRDSLVLTAMTTRPELIDALLDEPSIINLYLGDNPTTWLRPGIPHDGYLGEVLMRTKGMIRTAVGPTAA
jgi:hypothetical protein